MAHGLAMSTYCAYIGRFDPSLLQKLLHYTGVKPRQAVAGQRRSVQFIIRCGIQR
jgi:hypothetical protein